MKHQKQSNYKITKQNQIIHTIDGPPLDFSFKNIRSLNQLVENMPTSNLKPEVSDQKSWTVSGSIGTNQIQKHSSIRISNNAIINSKDRAIKNEQQKESLQQPKLQIIRTIEVTDHNLLQSQNKKAIVKKQNIEQKIKKIVSPLTTSLFLRYNKLTSIQNFSQLVQPVFPNMTKNLMWIDLSHNRLSQLSADLGTLENLKTLYLHVNYISDFAELEKVKINTLLKTLTIHANPLQQYSQFRIIIHSILPGLKKIDSTLITKRETQRAQILMKTMKKYPIIKNVKKLQQSENQEDD